MTSLLKQKHAHAARNEPEGRRGPAGTRTNDDRGVLRHGHGVALLGSRGEGVRSAASTGGSYPQWMQRTPKGCNNFAHRLRRAPVNARKICAPVSMPSKGAVM